MKKKPAGARIQGGLSPITVLLKDLWLRLSTISFPGPGAPARVAIPDVSPSCLESATQPHTCVVQTPDTFFLIFLPSLSLSVFPSQTRSLCAVSQGTQSRPQACAVAYYFASPPYLTSLSNKENCFLLSSSLLWAYS